MGGSLSYQALYICFFYWSVVRNCDGKKADNQSIEENNGLLWAKKIFKTKPNREISDEFKKKITTVFHHLTKEELIDKVLANYLAQTKVSNSKEAVSKPRKKN